MSQVLKKSLTDVKLAIQFHIKSFGKEVLKIKPPVIEAFIAETLVEV